MPQRLHPLTAENKSRFREYIRMLEVLAAYGLKTIGLRYFNIFGAHKDPDGAYYN